MTDLFTIVNLAVLAFLSWWEWRKRAATDTLTYWTALALRLAGGLAIGLLYKYYYHQSGDTFVFFNDASRLADLFYRDPVSYFDFLQTGKSPLDLMTTGSRSIFFVGILSIVNLATDSNYWLSSLWFSFFSFWCSYRLVIKLDSVFPSARVASRIALLFVPSVVFWSSGIIKESVTFGAVAIMAVHFLTLMRTQKLKWTGYLALVFFTYVLLSLKYYWGAVLIPAMATSLIVHWTYARRNRNAWAMAGVWMSVFLLLCIIASFTHPNFYMEWFLSVIVGNHDTYLSISRSDNVIEFYNLSPNWLSILVNSPWALWSGLFRPMIFEAGSVTGLIAAVENLFFLVLVLWKLKFIRMPLEENRLIAMSAIIYIVVLCIFLALSTPNFGTLSRYRVGFLSFFVFIVLAGHPVLQLNFLKQKFK